MTARSKLTSAISNASSARNAAKDPAIRYLAEAVEDLASALKELEDNGKLKAKV